MCVCVCVCVCVCTLSKHTEMYGQEYNKHLYISDSAFEILTSIGLPCVAQWWSIHLPVQQRRVQSLMLRSSICVTILSLCLRARKPQLLSVCDTATEAHTPRARAQRPEKPQQ